MYTDSKTTLSLYCIVLNYSITPFYPLHLNPQP